MNSGMNLKSRKKEPYLDWKPVIRVCAIGTIIWGTLIVEKIAGYLPGVSWPCLAAGILIIPVLFVTIFALTFFFVVITDSMIYRMTRATWNKHLREHALWDALYGFTLNDIGRIYGLKRKPHERNREFEARLLEVARAAKYIRLKKGEPDETVSDKSEA
ncbi:MAG: hypothetical protein IJH11_08240 [Lachnospiraceae bacterium]|nr:hypothetical protein [Lachnospiraceae bacterium]